MSLWRWLSMPKSARHRAITLVRNVERYLSAVIAEYRDECATGFPNDYEARRKLWHCAVVVCETTDDPEPWLDQLRELSPGHIRPTQVETTIRSAERKAR